MPTNNSWNTPDLTTDGQILIGRTGNRPLAGNLTSTTGTLSVTNGAGTVNVGTTAVLQTDTGWGTWGGAGNYFDDTTLGSFTVSRPGTGYINGVAVSWAGGQTVTGMTAGNCYWIYMDSTGTIGKASTRTDALFQNNIVLFECLRDSTAPTNNQITVKENHPYNYPVNTSNYEHDNIGALIENLNNGANITLNGTQGIQINGADVLSDHGLETTIPDSGGAAVTWNKMYTDGSGKWARQNATTTFTGYYNNAGTPTVLGASKFGVYTLYVSKDNLTSSTPVYFAVLDTSQYNNSAAASTAIANRTTAVASNELAGLEICQLGYIIFSQASNAITSVIISKTTLRSTLSTAGTNQASLVNTNTGSFNGILSAADTNVQAALDTIDNWGGSTSTSDLLYGSASNTMSHLSFVATATRYLANTGGGATIPAWDQVNLANGVTGTLPVGNGGTGQTTLTIHGLLVGNTTSGINAMAAGSSGQIVRSGGAAADPTWSTATYPSTTTQGSILHSASANTVTGLAKNTTATRYLANTGTNNNPAWDQVNLSNGVTDTLPVGNGGTGQTTYTDGQLLIGNSTGNTLTKATLTQGANVTITNGSGTITIAASSGGLTFNNISTDVIQASSNNAYYTTNSVTSGIGLPATSALGDTIRVIGSTGGPGFTIMPAIGQRINWQGSYIPFPNMFDSNTAHNVNLFGNCVDLVCVEANKQWTVYNIITNVTPVSTGMYQIGIGPYHTLILKMENQKDYGAVWACGANTNGELGQLNTTSYSSPVAVLGGFSFSQITVGIFASYGLNVVDGSVWAWGRGNQGDLGNNATASKSSPVSVVGAQSYTAISGFSMGCAALRYDGTVWCWGYNSVGQLGNQTTTNSSSPVSVVGGMSFTAIAGGPGNTDSTVAALKSDGTVWTWGDNLLGALGNNSTTPSSSPVSVVGGHSFVAISGGSGYFLALKADGSCWGWGTNTSGCLGMYVAGAAKSSPVSTVGAHSFKEISCSGYTSLGLKANGELWGWGYNASGQLGIQTTADKSSPILIMMSYPFATLGNRSHAGAGFRIAAVKPNGTIWMSGNNDYGELGNNSRTSVSSPVIVLNTP